MRNRFLAVTLRDDLEAFALQEKSEALPDDCVVVG